MFKKNICIGQKIYEPGTHFVLSEGFISLGMAFDGIDQYEITYPRGYKVVSYSWIPGNSPDILFVNDQRIRAKVYEKKGKCSCPDFGIPLEAKKNNVYNINVRERIYESGTHFVLSRGFYSENMIFGDSIRNEIFPPLGYRAVNYCQARLTYPEILYVNQVKVKAKIYEKKGQSFCPDFGKPVVLNKHR